MAISLPDARQLSDEVLEALRLRLRGGELGFTEADVADLLGVSRETVSRWWTAYASGGLDAIPSERMGCPGSGRTLSEDQARHLQRQIDDHSPGDLDIPAGSGTERPGVILIRKQYGIDLPVRTGGEYLKRWGDTAKVPRRHAKDQDPEEIREWLDVTYPAIEERAAREDAEIHWCDETGAVADEQPHEGDVCGAGPLIEVPNPQIRMNQISTITNEGAVHFMTSKETTTAALFITFWEGLLRETTWKVFLIVDRLRAHEAKAVEDWVAEQSERIELFFLLRYAPELNADEYLNNDLKGSINTVGLPENKEELRSRMERFMSQSLHLPEHVRNYFRHPCV